MQSYPYNVIVKCDDCSNTFSSSKYIVASKRKSCKPVLCYDCFTERLRQRMRKWNIENNPKEWHKKTALKMEKHPNFKGISRRPDGYLRIAMGGDTRKLYHRHLVEQHIGRELTSKEIVHHIDGDNTNNDISNLQVMTQAEHARLHFTCKK